MNGKNRKTLLIALATLMIFSALMVTAVTVYADNDDKEAAIDDGMAWLAGQQNPDGSWGSIADQMVGTTGLAVLKFETYAIENNIDPLHPDYTYYSQVRDGLDYIFGSALTMGIGAQLHGDPDTDGDGIGVYFTPVAYRKVYETGIAMMAIASSTHPGMVVGPLGSPVDDWTYREVVEDAMDYLAFAQTDTGSGRGGWYYEEVNNAGAASDNSNTGYAVLGLGYAQAPLPGGFELTVPDFVKTELDVFIEFIQDDLSGGSGYNSPTFWVNILKTGNLLYEMWFVGDTATTPRVEAAIGYLVNHWDDGDYSPGWRGPGPELDPLHPQYRPDWPNWPACYQAMYTTMKGLEAFGIHEIDGIDWQAEFEEVLIAEQSDVDGSWPNAPLFGSYVDGSPWMWDTDQILSTEWALLTLEKAIPPPPPPTLEDIEEKLDFWLPEIKNEIVMIEDKLDFWLPEIKTEIVAIEDKLDTVIDLEQVEVQLVLDEQHTRTYFMLTTVAGEKIVYDLVVVHLGATLLTDPADYTIAQIMPGVYEIVVELKSIPPKGTHPLTVQVEYNTYHGSAITTVSRGNP